MKNTYLNLDSRKKYAYESAVNRCNIIERKYDNVSSVVADFHDRRDVLLKKMEHMLLNHSNKTFWITIFELKEIQIRLRKHENS